MSSKKIFRPRDAHMEKVFGIMRRWNWRTRHRIGPRPDTIYGREMKKILRQFSWRRAH